MISFTAWQEEFCCVRLDMTVEMGLWLGHHQCHLPLCPKGHTGVLGNQDARGLGQIPPYLLFPGKFGACEGSVTDSASSQHGASSGLSTSSVPSLSLGTQSSLALAGAARSSGQGPENENMS